MSLQILIDISNTFTGYEQVTVSWDLSNGDITGNEFRLTIMPQD
jgi:hypothetical protein